VTNDGTGGTPSPDAAQSGRYKRKSPGRVAWMKRLHAEGRAFTSGGPRPKHGVRALEDRIRRGLDPGSPLASLHAERRAAYIQDLGGEDNISAMEAGIAATEQDDSFITAERARNKAVRDFTMKWFADRDMKPADSQANFMFVNIGRPVRAFRDACRAKGVLVARDFPPFEKTHCRIAFGTMDEMKKAVAVFGEVLGKKAAAAA